MKTKENTRSTAAATELLSLAHEVFINAMIQGATATEAYLEAYPGSSRESAYTSSSRLMDKPEIKKRIRQGKDEARRHRNKEARQAIVSEIERIDARLLTLVEVINGDWIRKDTTINKDTGVVVERYRQDPGLAIQSIKLEIKLTEIRARLVADLNEFDYPSYDEKNELRSMSEEELDETIRQLLKDQNFQLDPTPIPEGATPNKTTLNDHEKIKPKKLSNT